MNYPTSLPMFLADGFSREISPRTERDEMEVGHDRVYRMFTTTPQIASCKTLLTQAQFDVFYDFFESTLSVGQEDFSVRMRGPTYVGGLEWWTARFVEPYTATPRDRSMFSVSFRLLLNGGPFSSAP